ncbi:leucine-rich repeat and IQ domain-containing protein 1 isoform X2 [Oreochromis niloticus]|uniref:leucine-rich repeat and IQ domain-containing protein 1 isoform X2 n=1 Tax=Oreochromis niloticus TaxID=8128 RepID=UPI000DF16E8A|nr:leucine-rich repeat and IQ domain-containing protein 1 isoform X2 [Oreochromis niloticus]
MLELDEPFTFDETEEEEQKNVSCHEEEASDDFPPALLSYFETSKTRAAVCEKLILQELEDSTENMMRLSNEVSKDMVKLNEQVGDATENEENKTDGSLLQSQKVTQNPLTHNMPMCLNNEDGAATDRCWETEKYLARDFSKHDIAQEKHCDEEMHKNEERQKREINFQEELRKIMEAEKLQEKELELMAKRAQEKLEQEMLLQQELIGNLQKQVEQERRMIEEEQRRKNEEEKRKNEEMQAKKKQEEEDRRKMKEEEEKIKSEEEQERKKLEERKRLDEEEKKNMIKLRRKEEKKQKELWEREEVKKKREEEEIRKKEEERKMEEIKEEERRREIQELEEIKQKQKERKKNRKSEDEETRIMDVKNNVTEVSGRKMTEDQKTQNEEIISIKEEKKTDNRGEEEKTRKEVVRKTTEHKMERNEVEPREKPEVKKKMVNEDIRGKDETKRIDDKMQLMESEEKKKNDVESLENQDMMRKEEKTEAKEEELIIMRKEEMKQNEEQEHRNADEEIKLKPEICENKDQNTKMEHERKKDKEKKQEELQKQQEGVSIGRKKDGTGNKEDAKDYGNEVKENIQTEERKVEEEVKERVISKNELRDKEGENSSMQSQNQTTGRTSHAGGNTKWTSSADPLQSESTADPVSSETAKKNNLNKNISQIHVYKNSNQQDPAKPGTSSYFLPASLPEHTEQKRLLWMKECIPWSKLSCQNRRKQKGSARSRTGPRGVAEGSSLPPLCPHTLLQSTGWRSLQEVTSVTLEDLPGCSLFTLAQCTQLQSLTLRRCGLKSLEGINHLQELWYIDLQENDISFVDCENMNSLRVLQLAHNKLTSIHGLNGAENLDILDLSHNSITRIAGLESLRRLQRLSVNHNQLINTKGLRDVYTLLHLDCSHNHLANVEGLENSALLHTLDLRGNSLTEPPSLNNQVLLRELHLDDNSISSLHGLTACWLPLMQHLSAAQNGITQLPSMSNFVSLENLDLRYNCLSELQNVCENLEGCQFLREIHLTGNPLQQESGWRSTLQQSVPGLRVIDSHETDSFFLPPAVQQVSSASDCFLTFCQAQLRQTHNLQQHHSRELSKLAFPFNDVQSFCRHFSMTLKLAEDQRFTHEYGETTVSDEHWAASQTAPEKTLGSVIGEELMDCRDIESSNKVPPVFPNRDIMRCSYWNFEETPATESHYDTFGPKQGPATFFSDEKASVSSHQDLNLKNTAAVVIQQCWRKYKQICGNINAPPITEKGGKGGGDGGKPESRLCYINRSTAGKHYAATVIQAFWRGYTLRRRLTSALAAVACPSVGEDDTFEEVDIDEFVFDEAALEEHFTLMLSQHSSPRHHLVSEQQLSMEPPGPRLDPSQDILPLPKHAWMAGEHVDSAAQRISADGSNRNTSPTSTSALSGLSERSEKILEEWGFTDSHTALLLLRRARKMKSKRQLQKKQRDPSVRLALFRNCNYQLGPAEAQNTTARYNRNYVKAGGAETGHQQAERTEHVKQDQTQQWLHTQATHGHSDGDRFLPDINSSILSGGRVQLVANPAYTDCLNHTSGLWANSSLVGQGCKVNSYARRTSSSHARKEVPSPARVTSAPSKKERISFRDNPVQLSGGWGGGKKRDRVHK